MLVSVWSATKKDRRPSADAEGERAIERGSMRGGVGGDANSTFNKVSHGCHLNIVAYSLFSSSPREKETEDRQRDAEENERAREKRGRKVGDRARWRREKRKKRRGKLTEKIRGRGEGGGGRNGDHRDVLSVCIYTRTHVRVYTCRQTRVRELSSEKRTANRTFFASCMIQPQYLISSAASSAKLYLLMVMPFRGTYLFILRGLLG